MESPRNTDPRTTVSEIFEADLPPHSRPGETPADNNGMFCGLNLIGESPAFLHVLSTVKRIARHNVTVSIYGETGTGKELVARALHYLGPRASGPFIPINCGALPDTLLENELFGHERGAFTDARSSQQGLIAQAEGGTLFLDEVEELSPKAQVALLRFLQDGQYRPLGGKALKTADARIVTASNVAFADLKENGKLRNDLFYRLNIVPLPVPALRHRTDDIPLLAEHFLSAFRVRYEMPAKFLHASTIRWMQEHDWPGNIRELENVLHCAFLLSIGNAILRSDMLHEPDTSNLDTKERSPTIHSFSTAKAETIDAFEKRYLSELLCRTGGNVTRAAEYAEKERRTLGKLLKKHGLEPSSFQKP